MDHNLRNQRLRLLVKKLNKERKRQATKVDILCNDLVTAQHGFVQRLNEITFAAHFYKSLLGISYLPTLLSRAGELITNEIPGLGITFFLRRQDGCQRHIFEGNEPFRIQEKLLEDHFLPEVVDNICKSNRLCTADEMFGFGFEGGPQTFSDVSLVTMPLNDLGRSIGFVLIYRPASHPLMSQELQTLGLVTCGLSHAITACSTPVPSGR